jgi:HlyD family secretion protein
VKLVLLGSGLALALLGYGSYTYFAQGSKPSAEAIAEQKKAEDKAKEENAGIGALGRLEPEGEVFKIAPPAVGLSSRVAKILVKEGDPVKSGQPVAVMDTFETLRASGLQAEAQVRQAEAKLEQVKSGAKVGDVNAQKAKLLQAESDIGRLQSELNSAKLEGQRSETVLMEAKAKFTKAEWDVNQYEKLNELRGKDEKISLSDYNNAVSESERKSRNLAYEISNQQLKAAERAVFQVAELVEQRTIALTRAQLVIAEENQRLGSVSEVRPTDVTQAEEEVKVALANLEKAKADFGNAVVKSPIDGQIIKVHTKDNESVGNNGIMELGRTSQMYAIAEVDENLVSRVKLGQKAIVKSDAFAGEITGQVVTIGSKVGKNSITSTDPADKQDSRVVEVKVRLDSSELVRGLTNLQVKVAIKP